MTPAFPLSHSYSCFDGPRRLATGSLVEVAMEAKRAHVREGGVPILIFDNTTGRTIDVDTRGSDAEVAERLKPAQSVGEIAEARSLVEPEAQDSADTSRGRGRPKLGVIAREVTLLPRHWEWLATQSGGASVALRKLVEEARRTNAERDRVRQTQERTYHFMSVLAGDLPGFEEAARALFANRLSKFGECMAPWPADVREHAWWLASDHGVQSLPGVSDEGEVGK